MTVSTIQEPKCAGERITYRTSPKFPRPRKVSVTLVLPHDLSASFRGVPILKRELYVAFI